MEIIQVLITEGFGGSAKVFGLCNDQKMYRWDYKTGSWKLYMKSPDEIDKEEKDH